MGRFVGLVIGLLFVASVALAAQPKDYQVTGPVVDLTDDVITVEVKGKEKWEIGRTKDTKINGDLKKGSRVTVHYKMNATSVEVKETKAKAEKSKGDEKTKAEDKTKPDAKKTEKTK
jgi:hypothetical protein